MTDLLGSGGDSVGDEVCTARMEHTAKLVPGK